MIKLINILFEIKLFKSPKSNEIKALYAQILIILGRKGRFGRYQSRDLMKELAELTYKYGRQAKEEFKYWVEKLDTSQLNGLLNDLLEFRNKLEDPINEIKIKRSSKVWDSAKDKLDINQILEGDYLILRYKNEKGKDDKVEGKVGDATKTYSPQMLKDKKWIIIHANPENPNQVTSFNQHHLDWYNQQSGINEIKILKNVTPQIVINLYEKLDKTNNWRNLYKILDKYQKYSNGFSWYIHIINELPQNKLNSLYIELLNLQQKNTLN